jgi:hypothetical protein
MSEDGLLNPDTTYRILPFEELVYGRVAPPDVLGPVQKAHYQKWMMLPEQILCRFGVGTFETLVLGIFLKDQLGIWPSTSLSRLVVDVCHEIQQFDRLEHAIVDFFVLRSWP